MSDAESERVALQVTDDFTRVDGHWGIQARSSFAP